MRPLRGAHAGKQGDSFLFLTVQTAEICAQNLSPWTWKKWTKVERYSAEEKWIKNVWNIFEILNAFHITHLRLVILYEVEGNGKNIYISHYFAQQNQEPLSQQKKIKKVKVNELYFS